MAKKIIFSGDEEEDIRRMCACKEFVDDLKAIGFMKEDYTNTNSKQNLKPKSI